jgi:hypothetical protein
MYSKLQPARLTETAERLRNRIVERFPGAALLRLAEDLLNICRLSPGVCRKLRKGNIFLRGASWILVGLILAVMTYIAVHLDWEGRLAKADSFISLLEASLGATVFIGAGILFLVTRDRELRRRRALEAVFQLRSLAHLVDMHQLTKDPENMLSGGERTPSSPDRTLTSFELGRYLDYSIELLSLISKIGALYGQEFTDPVALGAVDQVESLTTGLSRKIWQKIMILDRLRPDAPEAD